MQETLDSLADYGYIILFLYSFGGGMIALLGAGILCAADKLDLTSCIAIAAIANFLGDTALFYMARYNKAEILPYFKSQRRKLALSQILFRKYGAKIIFFKKYIYGLKTLIPLAIGITKFDFTRFSIINAVCSIVWSISVGFVGYLAGDIVLKTSKRFDGYSNYLLGIFVILLFIIWVYFVQATKKKVEQ